MDNLWLFLNHFQLKGFSQPVRKEEVRANFYQQASGLVFRPPVHLPRVHTCCAVCRISHGLSCMRAWGWQLHYGLPFFFFLPWKPTCFLSYLFWFNLNFLHYLQEHNLHCIWAHLVIGLILICPFSSLSQIICIYEGGQRPLAYYRQCLNYLKKKKIFFFLQRKYF